VQSTATSHKIRQPEGNTAKKAEGTSPTPLTANHSKLRTDGVCIHAYTHSTHDCSHHRTKYWLVAMEMYNKTRYVQPPIHFTSLEGVDKCHIHVLTDHFATSSK